MSITSIIIDNKQTRAQRIAPGKVQLDLVALPVDEQNDTEPNLELRLYVNGQLLQNLTSDADGYVKKSIIINDIDNEAITVKLEDVIHGVQSKIKCLMIEGGNDKKEDVIIKKEEVIIKKEEVMDLVRKRGWNLADEKCKHYINDFDVVMAAVKQDGLALQFASDNLKNNYDIAMAAVEHNGLALKFASSLLKDLKEVCIAAIKQNILAYDFCGAKLLCDKDISEILFNACFQDISLLETVKRVPLAQKIEFNNIFYGDVQAFGNSSYPFIKKNRGAILHVMQKTKCCNENLVFDAMSEDLKYDVEFIKKILCLLFKKGSFDPSNQNTMIFTIMRSLPEKLKNDENFMLYFYNRVTEDGGSAYLRNYLNVVGDELKNNERFIMEIFRDYYAYGTFILSHLQSFPKCKLAKNAEFVLKLIKSIPNNVKIDPHWIRECLKHNVFPSSDEHHLQEIRKLLKKNAPSDG